MGNRINYNQRGQYSEVGHYRRLRGQLRSALLIRNDGSGHRRWARYLLWRIKQYCHVQRCRPFDSRPCHLGTRPR